MLLPNEMALIVAIQLIVENLLLHRHVTGLMTDTTTLPLLHLRGLYTWG